MKKILFIITQSEIGGAQRYLLEFIPYLASRGYKISVAAGEGDGELFREIDKITGSDPVKNNGVRPRYFAISSLVRSLNPVKDLLALVSMLKIIRIEKPDALFLQSTKAGFLGSLAVKLIKILSPMPAYSHTPCPKVIYRIGGWSFRDPRAWWMNKILFAMEKASAPWKDVIIVNSEFDKQLALKKKIAKPEKILKIYNGIEATKLEFLNKKEAWHKLESRIMNHELSNGTMIGAIANLYATKGIEYLIETAKILSHIPYPISHIPYFVVIGEGKERKRLEMLIKKYNLEKNFYLVGRIPNAYRHIRAFDAFVLSSIKEGFPWVLLEAMAAGVPIVSTNVGAVPEIIENENEGFLVPPRNSQALAEKIKKIIENPELAKKFSKNASEKVKRFSKEKMLKESEKIINKY